MQHLVSEPARRRFLGRIVREVARAELLAIEHAARETRRLGADAPPTMALCAIAEHAAAMQPRFTAIVAGYDVPCVRGGLGAALASLRDIVVDRIIQGERAYRIAMLDLRHGLDLVKLLREATRNDQLLGVIRWCDDWLGARRTLADAPAHADAAARNDGAPAPLAAHGDEPTSHDRH
jgi:hypothetical protein